jgi:uncharacterized protein (DUF3820 family)
MSDGPGDIVRVVESTEPPTEVPQIIRLVNEAVGVGRYQIGVTVLLPSGEFEHYAETKDFPAEEILKAHSKVRDLFIKQLEEAK